MSTVKADYLVNAAGTGAPTLTNGAVLPAGSAAAPAISPTGDSNTGIFFPAADTIAFAEGGAEAMRIDSSGNVGIGTSSPTQKLEVAGNIQLPNSGILAFYDAGGTARNCLQFLSGELRLAGAGAGVTTQTIYANGSERMRIDSSGNVGIGTASPGVKADINGVMRSSTWSLSGTGVTGGTAAFSAGTVATDTNWGMYFRAPTSSSAVAEYSFRNSADTERMRIDASGNLKFNSGYGSVATAYGCRAWVNFNGTGTVAIRASGNVSSITDNGTGDYTVNFTTAMPDADYSVTGMVGITALVRLARYNSLTTSQIQNITVVNTSNSATDAAAVTIAVFR